MLGMVRGRSGQLGTGCESDQDEVELWNQMNVAGAWQLEHNTTTRIEGMIKDSLHVVQGVDCMQTGTTDMWEQNVYEVGRFLENNWLMAQYGSWVTPLERLPGLVQHGAANLWFQACASKSSQLRLATQATSRLFFRGNQPALEKVAMDKSTIRRCITVYVSINDDDDLWIFMKYITQLLYAYICLSLAALEVYRLVTNWLGYQTLRFPGPQDEMSWPQVVKMILKIDDVITSGDVIDEWALPHGRNIGNMKEHSRTLKQNSTFGSNFGTLYF